jgi:hypothetical protein
VGSSPLPAAESGVGLGDDVGVGTGVGVGASGTVVGVGDSVGAGSMSALAGTAGVSSASLSPIVTSTLQAARRTEMPNIGSKISTRSGLFISLNIPAIPQLLTIAWKRHATTGPVRRVT